MNPPELTGGSKIYKRCFCAVMFEESSWRQVWAYFVGSSTIFRGVPAKTWFPRKPEFDGVTKKQVFTWTLKSSRLDMFINDPLSHFRATQSRHGPHERSRKPRMAVAKLSLFGYPGVSPCRASVHSGGVFNGLSPRPHQGLPCALKQCIVDANLKYEDYPWL